MMEGLFSFCFGLFSGDMREFLRATHHAFLGRGHSNIFYFHRFIPIWGIDPI